MGSVLFPRGFSLLSSVLAAAVGREPWQGAWHKWQSSQHRVLYSVLSCYLVSLMVIVTQESTSSVGIPSRKPLGIDKFIHCVACMKPFLLRAGVLLKASSEKPPVTVGTFCQSPEAQFFPSLLVLRSAFHLRVAQGGQTVWHPICKLL